MVTGHLTSWSAVCHGQGMYIRLGCTRHMTYFNAADNESYPVMVVPFSVTVYFSHMLSKPEISDRFIIPPYHNILLHCWL